MAPTRLLPLVALCIFAGCDQGSAYVKARTAAVEAEADSLKTGRFQVVNGAPGAVKTVMLLDTRTGKTWLLCETPKDGTTSTTSNWCAMRFFGQEKAP